MQLKLVPVIGINLFKLGEPLKRYLQKSANDVPESSPNNRINIGIGKEGEIKFNSQVSRIGIGEKLVDKRQVTELDNLDNVPPHTDNVIPLFR